jgi:hypothetical protein
MPIKFLYYKKVDATNVNGDFVPGRQAAYSDSSLERNEPDNK